MSAQKQITEPLTQNFAQPTNLMPAISQAQQTQQTQPAPQSQPAPQPPQQPAQPQQSVQQPTQPQQPAPQPQPVQPQQSQQSAQQAAQIQQQQFEQQQKIIQQQQQQLQQQAAQLQQQQPNQPNQQGQQPQKPDIPTENPLSTQATLLISELRDGVVIMKDGSFRAVVACKSINFDLMSASERDGIEYSYQSFLDSLGFTTQILIRSQRVDISPYIDRLNQIRRDNDNMLLGVLMDDYIDFVNALAEEANIMDKSFFIVIPYYADKEAEKQLTQSKNFFATFTRSTGNEVTRIDRETYDKAITEINNRVDTVVSGLYQIGVHSVRLGTRELSELYYNFNNPDTAVREPLVDFSRIGNIYTTKGDTKNAPQK